MIAAVSNIQNVFDLQDVWTVATEEECTQRELSSSSLEAHLPPSLRLPQSVRDLSEAMPAPQTALAFSVWHDVEALPTSCARRGRPDKHLLSIVAERVRRMLCGQGVHLLTDPARAPRHALRGSHYEALPQIRQSRASIGVLRRNLFLGAPLQGRRCALASPQGVHAIGRAAEEHARLSGIDA